QGPTAGMTGADTLIITHSDFRPALDPLINAKRAQGRTVAVVDVQAAYDLFSFGERDPEAIRSLIRTAAASWHPAPRTVLLVGPGTVTLRPASDELDAAVIPPYLVDAGPAYREIACDSCYTRLDTDDVLEDPLPHIPIGRFPVHSLREAQVLVAKTET